MSDALANLWMATRKGHTGTVRLLLDQGADPRDAGALWRAAEGGHVNVVQLLLDR